MEKETKQKKIKTSIFHGIGIKISISIAVLLLIVCGTLGVIAYKNAEKILVGAIKTSLQDKTHDNIQIVKKEIKEQLLILEALTHKDAIKNMVWEEQLPILLKETKETSYSRFFITDTNGVGHSTTGKNINISERDYFKKALAGTANISDPIISKVDGSAVVMVAVPILDDEGKVIGVLAGVDTDFIINKIIEDVKVGQTGYAFMINKEGTTIAHPNKELVIKQDNDFKNVSSDPRLSELVEFEKRMVAGEKGIGTYSYNGIEKFMAYEPVPGTDWSLAVTVPKDEIFEAVTILLSNLGIASLIILIVSILVAFVIGNKIAGAINQTTIFAETIAGGDLSQKVPPALLARKDEIGRLFQAFDQMQNMLQKTIGNISTAAQELAASSEEMSAISQNSSADMQEVSASTEEISASLEEISAAAEEITASSQEMNASVTDLVNEMDQGNSTAKEVENRVIQVTEKVLISQQSAVKMYEELEGRMRQGIERAKVVEEISHMADAISNIAEQTNLLALNAAIEAARAGEHGKGFAVVAEEVRKLAAESATTVANIQDLTKEVQENINILTQDAIALLSFMDKDVVKDYEAFLDTATQYKEDAQLFYKITNEAAIRGNQVLGVVNEVSRAIMEVATTINQSSEGAQHIAQGTDHTSKSLVEVNESSMKLAKMAEELSNAVAKFKV